MAGNGQPGNAAVAGSATVTGDITVAGSATVHGTVALTGARNNTSWIFYTDNNREGLYLNPNFNGSRETAFLSSGDVTFSQRVSIGNVSCTTPSQCAGSLGINNLTLAVGGKIGAQGGVYVVGQGAAWPDYVFQPTYHLRPLAEVARFIEENHHLPEVPSAQEVQANGLELASMQAVLLRKVEELTLHLIELKKANDALQERVRVLEN